MNQPKRQPRADMSKEAIEKLAFLRLQAVQSQVPPPRNSTMGNGLEKRERSEYGRSDIRIRVELYWNGSDHTLLKFELWFGTRAPFMKILTFEYDIRQCVLTKTEFTPTNIPEELPQSFSEAIADACIPNAPWEQFTTLTEKAFSFLASRP